ncbi:GNAT family N-acetyltransferase [Halobacillus sp. B23F22_1]|uniref:GNAT family N-acetyltransferase n=1 Tax=Halobacillus sp. B23F22_1 TaxID=3459514 RepID=UPI00373E81A3
MIREAKLRDSAQLADLMGTLGYPADCQSMRKRLTNIFADSHYQTYVFEEDGELMGMIGMMHSMAYHTGDTHVRVIAFVVEGAAQGKGIGRLLMNQTEEWAKQKEAARITLNSGNRLERNKAHSVYEHLGFEGKATGYYKNIEYQNS